MAQGQDFQNTISGNFYEIAIVEKYDQTDETESFLGNTTAGLTTNHEANNFSVNPSTGRVVFEKSTHVNIGFEFSAVYAPDMQPLVDAGILDSSTGEVTYTPTVDAVRVYVYGESPENLSNPAEDAAEVIAFPDCEISVATWDFPEDGPVEFPFTGTSREKPIVESLTTT